MRYAFLITTLLSCFLSKAQTLNGKLYFLTGTGGIPTPYLGYIQYPDETFGIVDSIQLSDFTMIGDKLFATAYIDVIGYDTANHQTTDTIPNVYSRDIEAWDGKLVASSIAEPYFRVYDIPSRSLIFSLDTLKLPETPTDIAVWNDKAFLMFQNSVMVVDLMLQDTIATIATPHPYTNQDFNYFLIDAGADFYIDVEYQTGGIRFSLLRMNKTTFQVQTVFHNEDYANFSEPIVADDKIYLGTFDTHYNITDDSLYISPNSGPITIEYDNVSKTLFLYHNTPSNGVSYLLNGSFSDTVMIQGYLTKALFVSASNDTVTRLPEKGKQQIKVYPNPASGFIIVESYQTLNVEGWRLLDANGKIVGQSTERFSALNFHIDARHLIEGIYFLNVLTERETLSYRFVNK